MDKKFVMGIAAMAALTLVSCSSDDLDSFSDNSSKNEAISFDGYLGRSAVAVNGTRGSVETKETLRTKGFGVFGKYDAGDNKTSDPKFFVNQKVTCSNSKWTYTPLKYWPTQGQINFYAYAPYKEGQTLKGNTNTFDFTVEPKAADQIDLLWANATGQIKTNFEGTTKEKVKFLFKHALSRLGYTVKLSGNYSPDNATFTLKKITLAGSPDDETKGAFYKTGTIDLSKTDTKENLSKTNTTTGLWTAATDNNKQNFTWFDGTYIVKSSESKHPTTSEDKDYSDKDYLFVIPQNFSEKIGEGEQQKENPDKLYVIVEYDVTYTSTNTTIKNKVYKKLPIDLMQGKAYKLNLTIGLPIEFDIDVENVAGVEDWTNDTDNKITDLPIDSWDDIERK